MPKRATEYNQYLCCNAGWPIRRRKTEIELDGGTIRFVHFQRWLKTSTIERSLVDIQTIETWNGGVIVDRIGLIVSFKDGAILRSAEGIRGYGEFVQALMLKGYIGRSQYDDFDRDSRCGDSLLLFPDS